MVLEIGGVPGGYLEGRNTKSLIRTNVYHIPGLDTLVDAQLLPFPDRTFDLVFMIAVDYYIPELQKAFQEIFRVSKPGATFINATYTKKTLDLQKKIDSVALHNLNTFEYIDLYKRIGFTPFILKILNNPPKNPVKGFIWSIMPRAFLLLRSQWRIFVCKKIA